MQRSKQQALMFLLGAVLVGGVLGFSADRVLTAKKPPRQGARVTMYNDIGLDSVQRVKIDSILDATNCKTADFMRPLRPSLDSIRSEGRAAWLAVLTPAQRQAYDDREKRARASADSAERHRDSLWAKEHPGVERPQRGRCPGSRQGGGGSDRGGLRPLL